MSQSDDIGVGMVPRRNRMDKWSPAEHQITRAMQAVEEMPAHKRLTDAITLLGQAREAVADYVDAEAARVYPPPVVLSTALQQANQSKCQSKRGAVVFRGQEVFGYGFNDQVTPRWCDGSDTCKKDCRHDAVHAEQFAILGAGSFAIGADMLHVKTVNGVLVPSGVPSCVQCSKLMVAAGILGAWLYHSEGWKRYAVAEFHRLSIYNGIA